MEHPGLTDMTPADQIGCVTGANRGIGYELTRQLADQGTTVIAGYRNPTSSEALLELARQRKVILPVQIDVTSEEDCKALKERITTEFGRLDLLINNAGINHRPDAPLEELVPSDLTEHLEVNVGGVMQCTTSLLPLLKQSSAGKIINLGSRLGSMELTKPQMIPYAISKAALNMLTKQQALAVAGQGITVVSISPGWVRTDMGGPEAPLSVSESVASLVRTIEMLTPSQNGQFLEMNGAALPY